MTQYERNQWWIMVMGHLSTLNLRMDPEIIANNYRDKMRRYFGDNPASDLIYHDDPVRIANQLALPYQKQPGSLAKTFERHLRVRPTL